MKGCSHSAPLHGIGSIDGLATSTTAYGHILVAGASPRAMLDGYRRVVAMGGGVAIESVIV